MKKFGSFFFFISCASLFSLEKSPWLGTVYEFELFTDFYYSQYKTIENAVKQPSYAYNNYVTEASLAFTPTPAIDAQIEVNMARTPHQTYGFRSGALQLRYRFLDDIAGDLLSLTAGMNARFVTGRAVRDVSSPYASYVNGEATVCIGKEFTKDNNWKTRGYLFGSLGLANHGSFWNSYKGSFEARFFSNQAIEVFSSGYFGYGAKSKVVIDAFRGWGYIRHGSIDVGTKYSYLLDIWGVLSLSYSARVWAYSYPKAEQTIQFTYDLPFSFF